MKKKKPDWEAIAMTLGRDVIFALNHLKAPGSPMIYNREKGEMRHWRERFADSLEMIPEVKVDREAMHALDLPAKERRKFFKDREKAEQAEGGEG